MKRKTFIQNLVVGATGAMLLPNITFPKSDKVVKENTGWIKTEHRSDDYNAFIKCDAIEKNTKIVHISDSHLTVFKNGKSEFPEFAKRMKKGSK